MKSIIKDEENAVGYHSNNVKKVRLNSTLAALLDDPILADVPKNPTLSHVDTLISLELGSAMRISVLKLDGTAIGTHIFLMILLFPCLAFSQTPCFMNNWNSIHHLVLGLDVVIMNSATLKDLKLAIKKKVNEMEQSKMGHRHISWYSFLKAL